MAGWITDMMADAPIATDEELVALFTEYEKRAERPTHCEVRERLEQLYYSRPHPTFEEDKCAHMAFRTKCDIVAEIDADTLLAALP